jgi:hypothetical protein
VENGTTISNNLNEYKLDRQFEILRRVLQTKQRHPWIEERHVGHIMLQATPIIPREMQTGETQKHTNNLLQNSRREEHWIENAYS